MPNLEREPLDESLDATTLLHQSAVIAGVGPLTNLANALHSPNKTEVLPTAGRNLNPMRHTDKEIEQAAARFDQLADDLNPDTMRAEETNDLRRVAVASDALRDAEAPLREAVQLARAHGRSWNQMALGVSRQAARQRRGEKVA
jgi:hypothetical protein